MSETPKDYALRYIAAGLSILPVKCDGSKGPTGDKWSPLTTRILTPAEVEKHWGNGNGERGIGIIGGAISGNLERIDFDDENAYCDWILRARMREYGGSTRERGASPRRSGSNARAGGEEL